MTTRLGLPLFFLGLVALAVWIVQAAGSGDTTVLYAGPTMPAYLTALPQPTQSDPSAFLNAAIRQAGENAEDAVEIAMATARSEDATAQATHDAWLLQRAEGAARAAVIPTAEAALANPYRPCRDAAKGETCVPEPPTPRPTQTPPPCGQGFSTEYGVKVCRGNPTATATPAPTDATRGRR